MPRRMLMSSFLTGKVTQKIGKFIGFGWTVLESSDPIFKMKQLPIALPSYLVRIKKLFIFWRALLLLLRSFLSIFSLEQE